MEIPHKEVRTKMVRHWPILLVFLSVLAAAAPSRGDDAAAKPGVWVRVTLVVPRDVDWKVHIIFHHSGPPYGIATEMYVGDNTGTSLSEVNPPKVGRVLAMTQ